MTRTLLLSAALGYAGFALLCLSMHRHERQLLARQRLRQQGRIAVRVSGWTMLAASILPPLSLPNPGIGLVAWFGLLTVAAAPLTLGLNYAPAVAGLAGPGLCILAAALWLML